MTIRSGTGIVLAMLLAGGATARAAPTPSREIRVIATLHGIHRAETGCIESAISQLLGGRGVAVSWVAPGRPEVARRPSPARDGKGVTVTLDVQALSVNQLTLSFVKLPDSGQTVRNVPLPNGADEAGCEVVADVVESTVMTLAASSSEPATDEPEVVPARSNIAGSINPDRDTTVAFGAPTGPTEPWSISAGLAALEYGGGFGLELGPAVRISKFLAPAVGLSVLVSGPDFVGSVPTKLGDFSLREELAAAQLSFGIQLGRVRPQLMAGVGLRHLTVRAPPTSSTGSNNSFWAPLVLGGAAVAVQLYGRVDAVLEAQVLLSTTELSLDKVYGALVGSNHPTLLVVPAVQVAF
jgi:hypothetical protein